MTAAKSFDASSSGSNLGAAHQMTSAKSLIDAMSISSFCIVRPQKRSLRPMVRTTLLSLLLDQWTMVRMMLLSLILHQ